MKKTLLLLSLIISFSAYARGGGGGKHWSTIITLILIVLAITFFGRLLNGAKSKSDYASDFYAGFWVLLIVGTILLAVFK